MLSTKGHAEGTAVGFNKAKKGARIWVKRKKKKEVIIT